MRIAIVLLLLTGPALADPPKAKTAEAMHTDDCARARKLGKTCVLDMKGDSIKGNSPTAGGTAIGAIELAKMPSLVHPRTDFIVEILRSAEDL